MNKNEAAGKSDIELAYEKIKSFIGEDRIEGALEYLMGLTDDQDTISFCNLQFGYLRRIERENQMNTITFDDYTIHLSKISSSILKWIDTKIVPSIRINREKYDIEKVMVGDMSDLKNRLIRYIESNRINTVYAFLERLVSSVQKLYEISAFKESYQEYVWQLSNIGFTIKDWELRIRLLSSEVKSFINTLEEKDLILKWRTEAHDLLFGIRESDIDPLFALFSQADSIKVPDQIVDGEEKQRYKRLMYLYQDAYQAGEYKVAYEYCLQMRAEIEPESAQLYEYLMLSYFRMQLEDRIIIKALDGDMKALNYLFVYASRFKQLQKIGLDLQQQKDKNHVNTKNIPYSETGEHNLRQIASGLMVALATEYSKVDYDYTVDFYDIDFTRLGRIKRCIDVGLKITHYIGVDLTFAEIIVNELLGGNKHQWLTVNNEGKVIEKNNHDALRIINDTKRLISYYAKIPEDEVSEKIAENLFSSLEKKYSKLKKRRVIIAKNSFEKRTKYREAVYKCMESYKISTIVFPQKAKKFCLTPIKELSGIDSILDWFILNADPNLIIHDECTKIEGVNPKQSLEYFTLLKDDEVSWDDLKLKLMEIQYKNLVSSTNQVYDGLVPKAYNILQEGLDAVNKVLKCLEDYYICYFYKKDKFFLDKLYDELVGNNLHFWFSLNNKGFKVTKVTNHNVTVVSRFYDLITSNFSEAQIRKDLSSNFFTNIILKRYHRIRSRLNNELVDRTSARSQIFDLMRDSYTLYKHGYQEQRIADLIFSEFIEEKSLAWIAILPVDYHNNKRNVTGYAPYTEGKYKYQEVFASIDTSYGSFFMNQETRNLRLDVIKILVSIFKGKQEVLDLIKDKIVDNRYMEDLLLYQSFSPNNENRFISLGIKTKLILLADSFRERENDNEEAESIELKKNIINILERCKMYFKITKNPKYLDLLIKEFLLNEGKTVWYKEFEWDYYPLNRIKIPHKHNVKLEGFDIWEERGKLMEYVR